MNDQVHIFGPQFSTFVRSVQLCCEEKGITYTVGTSCDGKRVEFHGAEHFELHPLGKVPVLFHGEHRLYETPAICRYLDAVFGGPTLQPDEPWPRALVDQWCNVLAIYADDALIRRYLLEFAFPKGEGGRVRMDKVEAAQPQVTKMLALLEAQLGEREFLVTDRFTIADAIAAPMLDYVFKLPPAAPLVVDLPHLTAYLERLRQRPSGQRTLIDTQLA